MQLRPHQIDALDSMSNTPKGKVIIPTGGGKTMCMIEDAKRVFSANSLPKTIVVVAPRILLAHQLCEEFLQFIDAEVIHVHSGDTKYNSTTKTDELEYWYNNSTNNLLIFTTYHSLHRVSESLDIEVDTIYFDEAHNSVQKNFIEAVEHLSIYAKRSYFFTATPKHSLSPFKIGMNDTDIFGDVICNVPAPQLVEQGYILPPKVEVYKRDLMKKDEIYAEVESDNMLCLLYTSDAADE